eukprot:s51_g11.t2
MASVICDCGKTVATFLSRRPVHALECFCCDCSTRAAFLKAALAKVALTTVDPTPVLLQYFPGKVLVTPASSDALRFNRLRESSNAVNACATCCGALMFVDHPNYEGQRLMCSPQIQSMRDLEQMPPSGRVFIRDWPVEKFAEYEKRHPIEGGSGFRCHQTGDWVQTKPYAPPVDLPTAIRLMAEAPKEAKSFKELLELAGSIVETLNIPEPDRSARLQKQE